MADDKLRESLKAQIASRTEEDSAGAAASDEEPGKTGAARPNPLLRASKESVVSFYRQFAVLNESGLPLVRCLQILQQSVDHKHLAETAGTMAQAVESGRPLNEAMAVHPWYFGPAAIAVVRAAHEAGSLTEALNYLADSTEHGEEIRGRIENALAYPVILMGLTLAALLLMLIYVVPTFTSSLANAGAEFEGIPALIIVVSDFVRSWYGIPLVVAGFLALVYALLYLRRTRPEATDRVLGRLPVVGRIMLLAHTSQFTDVLYMLTRHGVPLPTALSMAVEGVDNAYLRSAVDKSREEVESGRSLVAPLRSFPNLPPVFIEMLAVGELSGQMTSTLGHLSRYLRRRLQTTSERFAAILQPLMLITTGLIVIVVILAFFTTYFDVLSQLAVVDTDNL